MATGSTTPTGGRGRGCFITTLAAAGLIAIGAASFYVGSKIYDHFYPTHFDTGLIAVQRDEGWDIIKKDKDVPVERVMPLDKYIKETGKVPNIQDTIVSPEGGIFPKYGQATVTQASPITPIQVKSSGDYVTQSQLESKLKPIAGKLDTLSTKMDNYKAGISTPEKNNELIERLNKIIEHGEQQLRELKEENLRKDKPSYDNPQQPKQDSPVPQGPPQPYQAPQQAPKDIKDLPIPDNPPAQPQTESLQTPKQGVIDKSIKKAQLFYDSRINNHALAVDWYNGNKEAFAGPFDTNQRNNPRFYFQGQDFNSDGIEDLLVSFSDGDDAYLAGIENCDSQGAKPVLFVNPSELKR